MITNYPSHYTALIFYAFNLRNPNFEHIIEINLIMSSNQFIYLI